MQSNVALIPARSGSKELKNKNILKVNGFPLLAFSIRAALLAKRIDRVVVSTDYEVVKHALDWFSAEVGDPVFQ